MKYKVRIVIEKELEIDDKKRTGVQLKEIAEFSKPMVAEEFNIEEECIKSLTIKKDKVQDDG